MKKFLLVFFVLLFSFSTSFAALSSVEKSAISKAFSNYEISISTYATNEQLKKLDQLITAISNLEKKSSGKTYDVLMELKNLAQNKFNILNSQNKYVDSPWMKNLYCNLLWVCETISWESINNENYFWTSGLEVSLNMFSPSTQVAPISGIVSAWRFDFWAVWEDISINAINVRREGLWNSSDIRRVFFERNGVRVSNTAAVTSDGYIYLTFSPALVINRGSTANLDLMVEMNASRSWWEHRFSIVSVNDIQSQDLPKISWNFPVRTGYLGTTSYSLTSVDVSQVSGEAYYSPIKYEVVAGTFSVSVPSGQDDFEFKSIKLRNSWTADSTLLWDVSIYKNWQRISNSSYKDGRNITIILYNLIKAWTTANYEIRIDMIACKGYNEYWYWEDDKYYKCEDLTNENYKFEIRSTSDIEITDYRNGFSPQINLK